MLCDKRTCLKAILTILLLYSIINVPAMAKSVGTLDVARIVNGSHSTANYAAGDMFVVELDYTATGTLYAASVNETLPNGWNIVDSSRQYTFDGKTYRWDITSPISGITSGKIYYLAQVKSDESDGSFAIKGDAAGFNSFDAVNNMIPSSVSQTMDTNVNVVDVSHNGPCIWVTDIKEYSPNYDMDNHLESSERMFFRYKIYDNDGMDLNNVNVYVNGQQWTTPLVPVDETSIYKEVITANIVTAPDNLVTIRITATDNQSISQQFSMDTYIPAYDYSAWYETNWNGMNLWTASVDHTSSQQDGNWILLDGGNYIRMPEVNLNYSGPQSINYGPNALLSQIPFLGSIFNGMSFQEIDATPASSVNVPSLTVPPNGQYKTFTTYTEGKNDTVVAYFNGDDNMDGRTVQVMLLDLTPIADKIDFTDSTTIKNSVKDLSIQDITKSVIDSSDFTASSSGDFTIDSSRFSELAHMKQGYYALMVWDNSVPEVSALVSSMPIIVTKSDMTVDLFKPAPQPGDSLSFTENMPVSGSDTYTYATMLIPEANYSADMTYTSTGTLDGSKFNLNMFGMKEDATMYSDGSIHLKGLATDATLSKDDLGNMSKMKDIMMNEMNGSSVSLGITTTTLTADVPVVVNTKSTMPEGNYIVLTAVIDRNTGEIAAINQTTLSLGSSSTYTYTLHEGFNLISVPLDVTDNNIDSFFPPEVKGQIWDLWGWDASTQTWTYFSPDPDSPYKNFNPITTMDTGKGYWINMNSEVSFTIHGTVPAGAPGNTGSLLSNMNLVGVTGTDPASVDILYPTAWDVWRWDPSNPKLWDYYSFDPNTPYKDFGVITTIQPGEGIWVNI